MLLSALLVTVVSVTAIFAVVTGCWKTTSAAVLKTYVVPFPYRNCLCPSFSCPSYRFVIVAGHYFIIAHPYLACIGDPENRILTATPLQCKKAAHEQNAAQLQSERTQVIKGV